MRRCIGCGFCCLKAACGAAPVNEKGVCSALEWTGTRHVCSLMLLDHASKYREMLHEGAGCCASLNSWYREPLRNRIGD